jgi:hypothetical protein
LFAAGWDDGCPGQPHLFRQRPILKLETLPNFAIDMRHGVCENALRPDIQNLG